MIEFLIILALIWLVIASISDLKKREVPNWLSFSLIIFALAYRAFYAVINGNLIFFLYGLIGFVVFVGLAYAFYYARIFAGGDAKLLMGLGAILPLFSSFRENLFFICSFIFLLLLAGGVYGLLYSGFAVLGNRKNFIIEFKKQLKLRKNLVFVGMAFAFFALIFAFYFNGLFFFFPILFLLFPVLFIYGKAVEESCMIKTIKGKDVTIGDWLYESVVVRIGGKKKIVKPYWEGLSEEEVKLIRKSGKKVKIKYGIPFVPSFLIAFLLLILLKDYLFNLMSLLI